MGDVDEGEWQWGSTSAAAKGMAGVDSSLRCPICSCLLQNAVHLEPCGHAFCSACIRRSLGFHAHCPVCRTPAEVQHIVKNPPLQFLVRAFQTARPAVLEAVKVVVDDGEPGAGASARAGASAPVAAAVAGDRRLPLVVYNVLKEPKLRKMLAEHGLPTTGSRDALIRRHRSFVTQFNANLDSVDPRPVADVVADVTRTERQVVVASNVDAASAAGAKLFGGAKRKAKANAGAGDGNMSSAMKASFHSLAAEIRARKARASAPAPTAGGDGEPAPRRWRVVWSEVLKKPFFFCEETGIGQFDIPSTCTTKEVMALLGREEPEPAPDSEVPPPPPEPVPVPAPEAASDAADVEAAAGPPPTPLADVLSPPPSRKRQRLLTQPAAEPETWACTACTFLNPWKRNKRGGRPTCSVCSTPMPPSTLKAMQ